MISPHNKGPTLKTHSFASFQSNFLSKSLEHPKNEIWVTPDIIEESPNIIFHNIIPSSENSHFIKDDVIIELPNVKSSYLNSSAENTLFKKDDEILNEEQSCSFTKRQTPMSNFGRCTDRSLLQPLIKKFIYKLKNAIGLRNLDRMNNLHLPFINDLTSFLDFEVKNSKVLKFKALIFLKKSLEIMTNCSFIKTIERFFMTHNTVFFPYQSFKVFWDFLHLMVIIYWFFFIPLFFAFDEFEKIDSIGAYFTIFFMIFDIFLNFNTAYFHKGLLERSRWKIFCHYCKKHLKFDLITLVPIFLDVFIWGSFKYNPFLHFLKFIFFLKISTFKAIFSRIYFY